MPTSQFFSSLACLLPLGIALLTQGAWAPPSLAPPASGQLLASLLVPAGAVVLRQPLQALGKQDYWLVPSDSLPMLADRQQDRPFAAAGVSLRALTHALLRQQMTDTAAWQAAELPQATVVTSTWAPLPPLPRTPAPDRAARRARRRYNQMVPDERDVYELSRPAFDSTGRFATVLQERGKPGGRSTRLLVLAKRADGWYLVGIPRRWVE